MSALIMGQAFYVPLDTQSSYVLVALADHADSDGRSVRPGVKRIATKAKCSERTVQYVLRYLEVHGLIVAERCRFGGRGHATEFRLDTDAIEAWYQLHKAAPDAWEVEVERVQRLHPSALKGATCSTKGCNLKQERVQRVAPQPSENHQEPDENSVSKENPRQAGEPIGDYLQRIAGLVAGQMPST